jgi:signal transduction histidine kinase
LTLRTGLALLITFLVLGVALSQGLGYVMERNEALHRVQRLMQQQAQSGAETLRQRLERTRAFLALLAANPTLQGADRGAKVAFLHEARQLLPPFTGLLALSGQERIAPGDEAAGQRCPEALAGLAQPKASQGQPPQSFFSGHFLDPDTCTPSLAMGYPLIESTLEPTKPRQGSGLVVATLSIQEIRNQLAALHHGLGQIMVFDDRGELLLASGAGQMAPGGILAFLEQNWASRNGRVAHIDGHELLLGWAWLNQAAMGEYLPGLLVVSVVDRDAVLQGFGERLLLQWAITGGLAVILLAGLWRWSRVAILNPLNRLQEVTGRLTNDALHMVKAALPDAPYELRRLSVAFDDMASVLYKSLCELHLDMERLAERNLALQALVDERSASLQQSLQGEAATLMEERYHLLLDRAQVGMALVDQRNGNRIAIANHWFERHSSTGRSTGGSEQKGSDELASLFPGSSYEVLRRLQSRLEAEKERESISMIMDYPTTGGRVLPCELTLKKLTVDEQDAVDGRRKQYLIVSCMDLSAQKQLERCRQAMDMRRGLEEDLLSLANRSRDSRVYCAAFVERVQKWLATQFQSCALALYQHNEQGQWLLVTEFGAGAWPVLLMDEPEQGENLHENHGSPGIALPGDPRDADYVAWRIPVQQGDRAIGVLLVHGVRPGHFPQAESLEEVVRILQEDIVPQLATTWTSMDQRERLARYAHEQEEQARLLAQANQELERANRTKDEFLATMSHELRTPLNAIIGFSEVLRDELAGPLSPEQLDYTREILRAGQHLLELINDILDLAKIEAGRMALDAAPADMAELCRTAQRMVRERAANKNITLTLELGEEMTTELMLDQRKVKQILLNLLSNAIKFTPAGGTITVRCARVGSEAILVHRHEPGFRPPPHAIAPGPYLELRVEDNGIGIAPENLGRLFAPFEQLDSSLSRHYEGTGLGLSLVKRFAELHGGLVHVDSTPGEGSTFVVWLPWREARE